MPQSPRVFLNPFVMRCHKPPPMPYWRGYEPSTIGGLALVIVFSAGNMTHWVTRRCPSFKQITCYQKYNRISQNPGIILFTSKNQNSCLWIPTSHNPWKSIQIPFFPHVHPPVLTSRILTAPALLAPSAPPRLDATLRSLRTSVMECEPNPNFRKSVVCLE